MCCNLETESMFETRRWILGVNSHLPDDIAVTWAKVVSPDFHARYSAIARRYKYYMYISPYKRVFDCGRAVWLKKQLDINKMQQACEYLLGEQDFSSFRGSDCQSKTPNRNIIHANVYQENNYIIFDVKANAFLHHMVRNIVGCLLEVGFSNKPPQWLQDVILAKDRRSAAITAPPEGLYLVEVQY
jgi:tRNA pseudouridine38-40 synthase